MARNSAFGRKKATFRPPPVPRQRLASTDQPVLKAHAVFDDYPCGVSSFQISLNDVKYIQGVLANGANFAATTICDVFEMTRHGGSWKRGLDDDTFLKYLKDTPNNNETANLRVIFCSLQSNTTGTSFGCQLSLSQKTAKEALKTLNVSPQFVTMMIGEKNYWAPGDFASYDPTGSITNIEFFCQQPRWDSKALQIPLPWNVYLNYDVQKKETTYLVTCGENNPHNQTIKTRLEEGFKLPVYDTGGETHVDPFFLHSMIIHESLIGAKPIITSVRHRLYDQLDMVDAYAKEPSDRKALERLTNELHGISQDADSLVASADMVEIVLKGILSAHQRFQMVQIDQNSRNEIINANDSIRYLLSSVQSQRRWIMSYKSRKDTAMNLVYNLVTQQDSYTNTLIAMKTNDDSSSMRTIAALTMIFLPGTFISSIFGMAFFDSANGSFFVLKKWWLYLAITVPLTLVTIGIWRFWETIKDRAGEFSQFLQKRMAKADHSGDEQTETSPPLGPKIHNMVLKR